MIRTVLSATLTLLLLAAAPAGAEDPLLSGYAGPGGGDQAVLGAKVIGGGKSGGSGGAGSSGSGSAAGTGSLQAAPAAPSSGSASASSGAPSSSGSSGSGAAAGNSRSKRPGAKRARHGSGGRHAGTPAVQARPAQPAVTPTYPVSRPADAGGLPLSAGDVLLALLGAGVVAAVAVATLRLTATSPEPGA